jgi:ribosomal protein S18 acetylase RimI-like enzyme
VQQIQLKVETKMIEVASTTKDFNFQTIRELYYKTWQYAYVGIVPQALLDNLKIDIWHPETRWNNTLVALDGEKVVGVCSFGPARRKKYQGFGEIYTLYVLPEYQHQGIGQKLFAAALENLTKKFNNFYLIVLKKNLIAQAFFEMFGFEETLDQIADQTEYGLVHEVVFTMNDKKSTLN